MTINPQYENEYNDALRHATDLAQQLNDYFHNLVRCSDKTQYVRGDEDHMLKVAKDTLERYHHASQNYFIR